MLPAKFRFIWPSGFREEDFLESAIQKQGLPMAAMFVNESELNEQSLGLPMMLPTKFRFIWQSGCRGEDFFRNQPIRNKNCLWRSCL